MFQLLNSSPIPRWFEIFPLSDTIFFYILEYVIGFSISFNWSVYQYHTILIIEA